MEKVTLITVTLSNVFSVIPIKSFINTGRYGGAILTALAGLSSLFMHASETKHRLPGLCLVKYSNLFLNMDRVFAFFTFVYGVGLFITNPCKTIHQLLTPSIGSLCLLAGERTMNLPKYTLLHCMWHFCAFYSLHLVNY